MEVYRIKLIIWIGVLLLIAAASAFLPALANTAANKNLPGGSQWVTPTPQPTQTSQAFASPTPEPTLTSAQVRSCIYPVAYWAAHPETWPEQVSIEGFTYTKDQALALFANPPADAASRLFIQLHAAYLNANRGPQTIQAGLAISAAARWLAAHSPNNLLSPADQDTATALLQPLADFNDGLAVPGPCAGLIPTRQPAVLYSSTPTVTLTPTPTVTSTATYRPYRSPTRRSPTTTNPPPVPPTRTSSPVVPSATLPPSATPITLPTPAPTDTPVPQGV